MTSPVDGMAEAVEAARRIVDASDRRAANITPRTSLGAFKAACRDLYSTANIANTVAICRALISLVEKERSPKGAARSHPHLQLKGPT